jgi:hypothetical protein
MPVPLDTDLDSDDKVPCFPWDQPMTVAELRRRLTTSSPSERLRLLGRILREARDTDVWRFTTPREVAREWPRLCRHLGRRRAFWELLLERWTDQGLLDDR